MSWIYTRTEVDNEVHIQWNGWVGIIYQILLLVAVGLFLVDRFVVDVGDQIVLAVVAVFFIYYFYVSTSIQKVKKEINTAAKSSFIKYIRKEILS